MVQACARGKGDSSRLRIQLPQTKTQLTYQSAVANSGTNWGISDPSAMEQVTCYAIAFGGTDLSSKSCTNADGTSILKYGILIGALPAQSGVIEAIVPAGKDRTISVIGFAASSSTACLLADQASLSSRTNLSAPHILGSAIRDLPPGDVSVEITAKISGAIKFTDCTAPFYSGTSAAPSGPALLISTLGTTSYSFGTVTSGSSADAILTVSNYGSSSATALSAGKPTAPFGFKNGTYPGTGGTCSTALPAGASCTIAVRFAPVTASGYAQNLEFTYNDGSASQTLQIGLTGTSVNPSPAVLSISDSGFDFGDTAIGATVSHTFSVSNSGSSAATALSGGGLAAPYAFFGGSYPGVGGTCGTSLASGATCTVVISYSPISASSSSDTLEISYDDGTGTQLASRLIQGAGATAADLNLSDTPTYDFGLVALGATAYHTFTVTNSGAITATSIAGNGLAAPYTFKGGTFPGTGGTCTTALAGGASCTLVVSYMPVSAGAHNATLTLNFNNGGGGGSGVSVNITGTGTTAAFLTISDSGYDFGNITIGSSADKTFTVTNSGGMSATSISGAGLAAPYDFKGGTYPGTGGTCTSNIASAATCTVVVTYAPVAAGVHSDSLEMNYYDGASAQMASRAIQGTGVTPALLTISDGPTYDFGTRIIGTPVNKAFTVTNSGQSPATGMSATGLASPYGFMGGAYPGTGGTCGTTLAAGASCTIVVQMTPVTIGPFADQIDLTYVDGAVAQATYRPITGTVSL